MNLPPWSFSMLDMFSSCPRKAFHKYLLKEKEPESEAMRKGNIFDKAMEARLKNGTPLPAEYATWNDKAASVASFCEKGAKLATQMKLGITKEFKPCGFFDKDVWGRGALDVLILNYPTAIVLDWKTGKNNEGKPWYNGGLQLKIFTAFVLKHHPKIDKILAFNVYEKEYGKPLQFTRDDQKTLWQEILPKIIKIEEAFKKQEWLPCKGPLCNFCSVITCNFHPEKKL
jgi:hypothetical protein